MDTPHLRCYLIGADTLLMECGDVLLENDHDICGVVSSNPRVEGWAREHGLDLIPTEGDYGAAMAETEFDYLFAITHLGIIPEAVLELPRKGAVNFHDGPLPRYAGLNAPVWALLHGEKEYGITWHEMTAGVDEGDVLLQDRFELRDDETALSLNTKCMARALETFPDLVRQLATGQVSPSPQDLEERSYFGRYDRPHAASLVDWSASADEVDAFVRALSFGPYQNPVGSPTTQAVDGGEGPFVVSAVSVEDPEGSETPGQVVEVSDRGISVACGRGVVRITEGRSLAGEELTPAELAGRFGLTEGAQLLAADSELAGHLEETDQRLRRSEAFWARRLRSAEAPQVPTADDSREPTGAAGTVEIGLPSGFREAWGDRFEAAAVAGWAVYLARTGRRDAFTLGLSGAPEEARPAELAAWYSDVIPLPLDLQKVPSFEEVVDGVEAALEAARDKGTFLRDLLLREPGLPVGDELVERLLPVGVSVGGAVPPGALVWLELDDAAVALRWDSGRLAGDDAEAMASSLASCLEASLDDPTAEWTNLPLLTPAERRTVLEEWNDTAAPWDEGHCIHELFEAQVARTPEETAVVFRGRSLTYAELDRRANCLANRLRSEGVGPDTLVGVHVSRSTELLVATLGVLKAGGAYVPLDPDFPEERIAFMIEDSEAGVVVTEALGAAAVAGGTASLIRIDEDWEEIEAAGSDRPETPVGPHHLAYAIYTSGSTGRPKGVLVEHRNVSSFFTGMDGVIEHETPGVWMAVTSLSFDISVLELFWTLARGFTVVVHAEDDHGSEVAVDAAVAARPMDFGLFMWGNDDGPGPEKYRLMLEGARFFDENGFDSVWTPERHFHAFGGPFPNPSVTGAALATATTNLSIRSGSCVSPLHHPIRVAEEWAVVDNLSDGRVGLSFAAGWQPNDFILRPESFGKSKQVMMEQIDIVRKLWRGEPVEFESPTGEVVPVTTLPRPVQEELPFWVTTAGNPDSYRKAGEMGANVLTHLLGQTVDEVAEKIAIYREARAEAGFDPETGIITLMLHTFVGQDDEEVREIVRQPMKDYLGSSMKLVLGYAWSFPAFKRPKGGAKPEDVDLESLAPEEEEAILEFAFERYFENSGLFGTPETCLRQVERCKAIGVDEIACLLDFGVDTDEVMESLPWLKTVRDASNRPPAAVGTEEDHSLAAQIHRHGVTHLQCTPSMARLLLADEDAREALGDVEHLMVGGEALPPALARELMEVSGATLTNMYGPTETTIWSSTYRVPAEVEEMPIGRPIANTRMYVLDPNRQPLPAGVPGDLYIAGPGVTRGYHRRPELTDERFVPDPFDGDGSRMYWTGDLASFRTDGVLDFLGRVDHQVKIRGYRIELGEIEAALEERSDVRSASVIVREDQPGDQRLAAYVVAAGAEPSTDALQAHLRELLPQYMVPGTWVMLERMPLTPNGKIDRNALPAPREVQRPDRDEAYVAPANELETTIAEAWQSTLGVERVGVAENFFDIGGHSLLVVQLHRKLSTAIPQKSISLVDLYRFPTIRALTDHLGNGDGAAEAAQKGVDRAEQRKRGMARRRRGN